MLPLMVEATRRDRCCTCSRHERIAAIQFRVGAKVLVPLVVTPLKVRYFA
jgi:hypothetical protein